MIAEATWIIQQPTFRNYFVPIGSSIKADFNFFGITSTRAFTPAFDVINYTPNYPFGFPIRSKHLSVALIKDIVSVVISYSYMCSLVCRDKYGELARLSNFTIACHDLHMTIESIKGYESTINVKVNRLDLTYTNMVWAQLIDRVHNDKFLWSWYQYSIWLVVRLINNHIGTEPTTPCLKLKYKVKTW